MGIVSLASGCAKRVATEQERTSEGAQAVASASAGRLDLAPPNPERVPIPAKAQDSCKNICDRSKELKCPHTGECLPNCLGMATLTPCSAEIGELFTCLLREPLEHWECGEDGVGAIREGYCDQEQGKAAGCMEQKLTR